MAYYLYVDGESHYMRFMDACKEVFGKALDTNKLFSRIGGTVSVNHDCKFAWHQFEAAPHIVRRVYFTSATGDDDKLHQCNLYIKEKGFEPYIVKEDKTLFSKRAAALDQFKLIEKPKGVDIALAVRVIEDAVQGNFEGCYLYTSDVDFLPVIQVVRRMGKTVHLFAHKQGLGKNSPLLYVPDHFADIGADRIKSYLGHN